MGLVQSYSPEPTAPVVAFDFDEWAQTQAALALIDDVAVWLGMPSSLVLDVMTTVPENLLTLLDSPQGWTALAGFVAAELGIAAPQYLPGVH